jgi:hypothetical protein
MSKLFGVITAMTSLVSDGSGDSGPGPIYLVAKPADEEVRFHVIGASSVALEAVFLLEVTNDGGNRSVHRGSARLRAGDVVTLSVVSVRPLGGEWRAHLRVEPQGGEAYEQIKKVCKKNRAQPRV